MASIVNQNDTNTNVNPGMAPATTGATGTGVNPGSSAMGSITPVSSAPKAASSGQFTNLQSYINANKGSGQNMANQISNRAQGQANTTNNNINSANTMIGSQIDAENARIANSSNFANQVQQDNATQITSDPNQLAAWNQLYSGNNNAQNIQNASTGAFANANTNIQNLQNTAAQAGTEQGRFGLLQQTLGRPTYNSGQQGLDQLLLSSGTGNNTLSQLQQNLAAQAKTATNNLNTDQSNILNSINSINSGAAGAQGLLKNTIGGLDSTDAGSGVVGANGVAAPTGTGALGALQQALYQRQQSTINPLIAQQANIAAAVADPSKMDAATQQLLGLTQGEHIYNTDLSKYITPTFNPGTVTEQGIANASDLANYNALNQLSGGGPTGTYLNSQNIGNGIDPTTGKAFAVNLGANAGGLQQAIQDNTTTYNNILGQFGDMQQNAKNLNWGLNADANLASGGPVANYRYIQNAQNSLMPLLSKFQQTDGTAAQLAQSIQDLTGNNSDWTKALTAYKASVPDAQLALKPTEQRLNDILNWSNQYNSMDPNRVIGEMGNQMNAIQAPVVR